MRILLAIFLSSLFQLNAVAHGVERAEENDPLAGAVFAVEEVIPSVVEVQDDPGMSAWVDWRMRVVTPTILEESIDPTQVVTIGKAIFDIIKAGAPVVNVKRDTLSVVPKGITDWSMLSNWQAPVVKSYRVTLKNGFNRDMVDIRFKVSAVWGGQYDGKGRYLAHVTVIPTAINVGWGVTLDMWTESREPLNMGTKANPLAAIGLDVMFRAKTLVSDVQGTQDFFLSGDGQMRTND